MPTVLQRRSPRAAVSPRVAPPRPNAPSPSPFVKWAGGKSQLLPELRKYVPESYGTYHEPFAGGGALFFDLLPERAVLNDTNEELMNAYRVIRDDADALIAAMSGFRHDETFFYEMRATDPSTLDLVSQAARFLYLNKCCFNGLYRVNKKGAFNVPFGRYVNPTICDAPKLKRASEALQNVVLESKPYQEVLEEHAKSGDFVYIDPPYAPVGKYSDFNRYTKEKFTLDDQVKLRDFIVGLKERGVFVMASNSHSALTLDLYKDFDLHVVEAKRLINKSAAGRSALKEVIIL